MKTNLGNCLIKKKKILNLLIEIQKIQISELPIKEKTTQLTQQLLTISKSNSSIILRSFFMLDSLLSK